MSRIFLLLGLVTALATAFLAEDCDDPPTASCNGGNECTLTVSLNGSGAVVLAGKPPDDRYHAAFGGFITWKFVNATGNSISVRLSTWELDTGSACPVDFQKGGGPGPCEAFLPTIGANASDTIVAGAKASPDDSNNPFRFQIFIAKSGEGERPIDPELQIDEMYLSQYLTLLLAAVSALLFGASWWTGPRARAKRAQLK